MHGRAVVKYRPTGSDDMPPMADDIHGEAVVRCNAYGVDDIGKSYQI